MSIFFSDEESCETETNVDSVRGQPGAGGGKALWSRGGLGSGKVEGRGPWKEVLLCTADPAPCVLFPKSALVVVNRE